MSIRSRNKCAHSALMTSQKLVHQHCQWLYMLCSNYYSQSVSSLSRHKLIEFLCMRVLDVTFQDHMIVAMIVLIILSYVFLASKNFRLLAMEAMPPSSVVVGEALSMVVILIALLLAAAAFAGPVVVAPQVVMSLSPVVVSRLSSVSRRR